MRRTYGRAARGVSYAAVSCTAVAHGGVMHGGVIHGGVMHGGGTRRCHARLGCRDDAGVVVVDAHARTRLYGSVTRSTDTILDA